MYFTILIMCLIYIVTKFAQISVHKFHIASFSHFIDFLIPIILIGDSYHDNSYFYV